MFYPLARFYARFRPKGMLVIARRDYLSGFRPKTFISKCSFSLLSKDRNLSSLPHTLELNSDPLLPINPSNYQVNEDVACWELLDDLVACKPTLFPSLCFLIFVEIQPYSCVCVCMPFLLLQVSSLASKPSPGCVDSCENRLDRYLWNLG